MAFDGSGTYSLPSPEYPAVSGELIRAAYYNAILLDLQTALSLCMVRDGQSLATGNFNMNSKKIVGLAAGTVAGDAVRYEQVISAASSALLALTPAADKFPYFTSGSAADMLTIVAAIRTVLASADVATMRTNMGVAYGTTAGTVSEGNHTHTGVYQPSDAELTALAGLTSAADSFPYFTGSGTAGLLVIVSAIRTLLASADVATFRTNAGLQIGLNVQAYDADICISDVAKAYTAQHYPTAVAITSTSNSVAFNNATNAYATLALGENSTLADPSGKADGQAGILRVTPSGAYTLAVHANWKRADGTAVSITPASGKKTWIWWECDGTYNYITQITQEA